MNKKWNNILNNPMVATLFITLGVVLSLLIMLQLGWLHLGNGYSSNKDLFLSFTIGLFASLYLGSVVIWTLRNKERDIIPVVVALVTPLVTYILMIGAAIIETLIYFVYPIRTFSYYRYLVLIEFLCFLLLSIRFSFIFQKPKPSLKQERIKRIRLKAVIVLFIFLRTQFVFSFQDIVPSKLRATKIVFSEYVDFSVNDVIYSINANGSHLTKLTDGKNPTWSPDLQQIAFEFQSNKHLQIYRINGDGSGRVQLTKDSSNNNSSPTWSPDGEQIAFVSDRDGNKEIYVMNADGSNRKRLTNNPGSDLQPDWSPDGKSIAFVSDRDGHNSIYTMNVDGSGQRRLTYSESEGYPYKSAYYPDWSPDGQRIVFSSGQYKSSEIYIINANGSEGKRIARGTQPTWAPDGRAIAFIGKKYFLSWDSGDSWANGLWIVELDNLGYEIRVAPYLEARDGTQHFQNPNWGPLLSK